jgi:hypothetical protein
MILPHKVEYEIWMLTEPQNTESPDLTGNNISILIVSVQDRDDKNKNGPISFLIHLLTCTYIIWAFLPFLSPLPPSLPGRIYSYL